MRTFRCCLALLCVASLALAAETTGTKTPPKTATMAKSNKTNTKGKKASNTAGDNNVLRALQNFFKSKGSAARPSPTPARYRRALRHGPESASPTVSPAGKASPEGSPSPVVGSPAMGSPSPAARRVVLPEPSPTAKPSGAGKSGADAESSASPSLSATPAVSSTKGEE